MTNLSIVHLYNNSLGGSLPPQWSSLRQLTSLRLDVNSLSGSLPDSWGNMSSLKELYLRRNSVVGTLPNTWGDMIHLTVLALDQGNTLSGTLPSSWENMSSLQELYLSSIQLTGALPSSWGNLSNLVVLALARCNLNGLLPESWGNLWNLTTLTLNNNRLSGSLPSSWQNMSRLASLILSYNDLNGSLPAEWGHGLTSVTRLSLDNNRLNGSLPDSWSNLGSLSILDLTINSLIGTLPGSWANIASLFAVSVANNLCSGQLPDSWGTLHNLYQLYTYNNSFSGSLPNSWGNLTQMTYLSMNSNEFDGTLPASWGQMSNLLWLYLFDCSLTGSLPSSWSGMKNLMVMYLCDNLLTGTLPESWSGLPNVEYMILFNNSLSGPLPTSWANISYLRYLYLYSNSLSGTLPAAWGNMSWLGYLDLDSNCLFGAVPNATTFAPRLVSMNLCGTNLTGGRLTTACANNSTSPSYCVAQPYRHTATPRHSDTMSLSLTSLYSVTRQTVSMSSATVSAAPSSTLSHSITMSNECTVSPSVTINSPSSFKEPDTPPLDITSSRTLHRRHIATNASLSTAYFRPSQSATTQNSFTNEWTSSAAGIVIPAPVVREETEVVVERAGKGLQIVSTVSGGVTSSGSLARMLATTTGGSNSGGLIDFGFLVTCAGDENPSSSVSAARSGVVSNIVLLAIVHAVLLIAAAGWGAVKSLSYIEALAEFCMPSSLMSIWIAVVPTTSDSIVVIMSQLSNSSCLAVDAIILTCGLGILIVPVAALCMLQRKGSSGTLTCNTANAGEPAATIQFTCLAWTRSRIAWATNRTWLWESHSGGAHNNGRSVLKGLAFVVLREFRVLWYPILDSAILVFISIFSALSGDDIGDQRGWMTAILVLLLAQLVVMVVAKPFTTVMSFAYQTISVALSCLSVAFQLAFMFVQLSASTTNTRWLLLAPSVCDLVIISISVVKMLEDVVSLIFAIARRVATVLSKCDTVTPPSSTNFHLQVDSMDEHSMEVGDEEFIFLGERTVEVEELLELNSEEHHPKRETTCHDASVEQLPEFRVDL
ncbi:GP46-like surface antigen, putative [Bodo saltans]|uniref:GP46-like surface antigen, putative n=1 Tax=Bodo saltans TaxID=75058 RepID=A0A0S4JLC0_BODSA|nr:GP46-like surface antigen, putative [Bodo saltans]|eukprot:CUG90057.1 GP46-like surface antigen, putative [Bodo saltans]